MSLITDNINILFLALWSITAIGSVSTRNQTHIITAVLLFLIYLYGQFPILWEYPRVLFGCHAGMFLIMWGLYQERDKYTDRLLFITFVMAICDAVFVMITLPIDYLHWALNILYLLLLVASVTGCAYTWKENKRKKAASNVHPFMAYSGSPMQSKDMVPRSRKV